MFTANNLLGRLSAVALLSQAPPPPPEPTTPKAPSPRGTPAPQSAAQYTVPLLDLRSTLVGGYLRDVFAALVAAGYPQPCRIETALSIVTSYTVEKLPYAGSYGTRIFATGTPSQQYSVMLYWGTARLPFVVDLDVCVSAATTRLCDEMRAARIMSLRERDTLTRRFYSCITNPERGRVAAIVRRVVLELYPMFVEDALPQAPASDIRETFILHADAAKLPRLLNEARAAYDLMFSRLCAETQDAHTVASRYARYIEVDIGAALDVAALRRLIRTEQQRILRDGLPAPDVVHYARSALRFDWYPSSIAARSAPSAAHPCA